MRKKKFYRKWSKELFREEEYRPIHHGNGTVTFTANCEHISKGIVILLDYADKIPCVFCANCGGWIATLKQWQEWDREHREIYKVPFQPKIQLTFSTADRCLRSFWDSEPIEGQLIELKSYVFQAKKARGLFRNLGKKITEAIRENEELNNWLIWNELKKEQKYMSIYIPYPKFEPNIKSVIYDSDFSTLSEIADELLEEGEKKK